MKLTDKKLLIFDLDGTLINSALDLAKAINYMLEQLGKDTFNEARIHGWVGNGALTLVKRALLGKREVDDSLKSDDVDKALKIFLDYYEANLCNATEPYPNVVNTLHALKSKGYSLTIVTNKPFKFVAPILKGLKMDSLFEVILGGDSLEEKKPHPLPLLHVCQTLNIPIANTVMIGDSKNDIQAANACSMESVGVTYGYNYGEDIGVHHPSIIIDNFSELNSIL
ncbi:MAG: phosphoglycolate phosphatase [Sulfurovum sp.]|nr:phosphoglycolate phosphatase [Sulfurovum sp.]